MHTIEETQRFSCVFSLVRTRGEDASLHGASVQRCAGLTMQICFPHAQCKGAFMNCRELNTAPPRVGR